jgi:hypothetical protein
VCTGSDEQVRKVHSEGRDTMEELDQRVSGLRGNGGGLPAHTQDGQGYRSGPGYYSKQRPRKTQSWEG